MTSVVKLGPWGGDGGVARDITGAPRLLESITIRHGEAVDLLAFSYRDRDNTRNTAGPWGGSGGKESKIVFSGAEFLTQVVVTVGPIGRVPNVVTSLKFITNNDTYGPFGQGKGTAFSIPVLNNGSIVGMFARAGDLVDSIGFYILPF